MGDSERTVLCPSCSRPCRYGHISFQFSSKRRRIPVRQPVWYCLTCGNVLADEDEAQTGHGVEWVLTAVKLDEYDPSDIRCYVTIHDRSDCDG